jgi:hypothetical protein
MNAARPSSRSTVAALAIGTIVAVSLFVAAYVVRIAGHPTLSDTVATVATIVLLAIPAVALIATAAELRRVQRSAAILAGAVLAVLVLASALALLASR